MEKFWFALKSHIYVDFKESNMLLYDTRHGDRIESTSDKAIMLIHQMYEPQNLGVISVDSGILSEPHIEKFIHEVIHKNMGDLMSLEKFPTKPVRLIPILNLQKDIDKYKNDDKKLTFFEKDIRKYLLEMNIYVNSVCDKSCHYCGSFYKQAHCCTTNKDKSELSIDSLKQIFEQIRYSSINSINISGGDIFKYSYLDELKQLSILYSKELHYYLYYKNYKKHSSIDSGKLELIITFPIDKCIFQEVYLSADKTQTKWHFIIANEEQYNYAGSLIEELTLEEYDFIPFYTGSNLDFFKENVFVDEEDIFFKTFQMREIFKNKKLNSNFFGVLYILPNGIVKANMSTPAIGNIQEDSLLNIIQHELINNTSWRLIRDSQPCSQCIYQFICPPLSNYEEVIGQTDLCHIENLNLINK